MDRYDSMKHYQETKYQIYRNAETIVLNRDEGLELPAAGEQTRILTFGLDQPGSASDFGIIECDGEDVFAQGVECLGSKKDMVMNGQQNVSNMLAAMALIAGAGVRPDKAWVAGGLSYPGLAHRCEVVLKRKGVCWINDSKGTNVGATIAAISGLEGKGILIAGGMGKGADFSPLKEILSQKIKHLILIGRDAQIIADAVRGSTHLHFQSTLHDAVSLADELVSDEQFVVLSPACSSYDMFDSFGHRGDCFRHIVMELADE